MFKFGEYEITDKFKLIEIASKLVDEDYTKCNKFFKTFAEHIYYDFDELNLNSLQEAYDFARDIMGFYAAYFHSSIRKKIEMYYKAKHPIYPDKEEITGDEVYALNDKYDKTYDYI